MRSSSFDRQMVDPNDGAQTQALRKGHCPHDRVPLRLGDAVNDGYGMALAWEVRCPRCPFRRIVSPTDALYKAVRASLPQTPPKPPATPPQPQYTPPPPTTRDPSLADWDQRFEAAARHKKLEQATRDFLSGDAAQLDDPDALTAFLALAVAKNPGD